MKSNSPESTESISARFPVMKEQKVVLNFYIPEAPILRGPNRSAARLDAAA